MTNTEYETIEIGYEDIEIESDVEGGWNPLRISEPAGAFPHEVVEEDCTLERCVGCGRGPGVVSAPGADRFDVGLAHAYNNMYDLMCAEGIESEQAQAIVFKLQEKDRKDKRLLTYKDGCVTLQGCGRSTNPGTTLRALASA